MGKQRGPVDDLCVSYMNTTNIFVVPDNEYDFIVKELMNKRVPYLYLQNNCGDEHTEECKCPKVAHERKAVKTFSVVRVYRAFRHDQFRDVIPEREYQQTKQYLKRNE